jgi:hypothetical protein
MEAFIVGMKATKAKIKTAMAANRPESDGSWKKTSNPMAPRI